MKKSHVKAMRFVFRQTSHVLITCQVYDFWTGPVRASDFHKVETYDEFGLIRASLIQ